MSRSRPFDLRTDDGVDGMFAALADYRNSLNPSRADYQQRQYLVSTLEYLLRIETSEVTIDRSKRVMDLAELYNFVTDPNERARGGTLMNLAEQIADRLNMNSPGMRDLAKVGNLLREYSDKYGSQDPRAEAAFRLSIIIDNAIRYPGSSSDPVHLEQLERWKQDFGGMGGRLNKIADDLYAGIAPQRGFDGPQRGPGMP